MLEVGSPHAKPVVRRRRRALLVALLILGSFGGLVAFLLARSDTSTGDGSSLLQAIFPPSPLELWRARGKASEPYVAAYGDCGGLWLRDMTWSVDGSKLYAAAVGGVQILERQGKRLVTTRSIPFQHGPYCIAADPKGRWVAVGVWHGLAHTVCEPDNPCYVDVFSTETWEKIIRLEEPTHDVVGVCFSPDGEYLLASERKRLLVWRTAGWSLQRSIDGFGMLSGGCVIFSPSNGLLVLDYCHFPSTAVTLKYRHAWEEWTGDWEWSMSFAGSVGSIHFMNGQEDEIICSDGAEWMKTGGFRYPGCISRRRFGGMMERLAWTPGYGTVAVGFEESVTAGINEFPGFVSLWRTSDFKLIAHFAGVRKPSCVIAFDPGDRYLATAWGTGNIVIWDIPRIVADDEAGLLPAVLKQEDDNHWGRTPIEDGK